MANELLTSFFSKASFVIRDSITNQVVAAGLKILSVSIKYRSTAMKHMREDGTTLIDSRIIRAADMEVVVMAPDINALSQLNDLMNDRTKTYNIVTRGLYLNSMMVEHTGIKQIPDVLSATPMQVIFKQLLVQNVTPVVCAQAADSSVIDKGLAALNSVTTSATDLFNNVQANIAKVF